MGLELTAAASLMQTVEAECWPRRFGSRIGGKRKRSELTREPELWRTTAGFDRLPTRCRLCNGKGAEYSTGWVDRRPLIISVRAEHVTSIVAIDWVDTVGGPDEDVVTHLASKRRQYGRTLDRWTKQSCSPDRSTRTVERLYLGVV